MYFSSCGGASGESAAGLSLGALLTKRGLGALRVSLEDLRCAQVRGQGRLEAVLENIKLDETSKTRQLGGNVLRKSVVGQVQ